MGYWRTDEPPSWCPDCIPTTSGWYNPVTRVLEVSSRFLKDPFDYKYVIENRDEFLPKKFTIIPCKNVPTQKRAGVIIKRNHFGIPMLSIGELCEI